MILDLFIYIIQFYINQNTFLPGFIIRKGAYFMSKTSNVYARIEPETKEQAEAILSKLGIPSSVAINMFYNQIILNNGLPFDVKIPSNKILNEDELTKEELAKELLAAHDEVLKGNTIPFDQFYESLKKDLKL